MIILYTKLWPYRYRTNEIDEEEKGIETSPNDNPFQLSFK